MEKNWCVEVWDVEGFNTEVFYTKAEALEHFKHIRQQLDSSKYIKRVDSIEEIDGDGLILITDLRDLE